MRNFQLNARVYYKFDEKHPYEEQPQNDSKIYGKGRLYGYLEGDRVLVYTDSGHLGKNIDDVMYEFKPEEILTMEEYFKLPEKDR